MGQTFFTKDLTQILDSCTHIYVYSQLLQDLYKDNNLQFTIKIATNVQRKQDGV